MAEAYKRAKRRTKTALPDAQVQRFTQVLVKLGKVSNR